MKWFRLYSEARNDAKLRSLTDAQHRVWFNLLCYASEMESRGCINTIDRELLAVECAGADTDLINETIEKLTRLRIVTAEAENVCFVNFMKRQYDKPSATPERVAERVSKHRTTKPEASNAVVTPSNAVVTPEKRTYSDTDLYSDSEECQKTDTPPPAAVRVRPSIHAMGKDFAVFWSAYPRKEGKDKAWAAWTRLAPGEELFAEMLAGIERAKEGEQWQRSIIPHPTTWITGKRWKDEVPSANLVPSRNPPGCQNGLDTSQGAMIGRTLDAIRGM